MKEIGSEFSLCSDKDYYFNRINSLGKSIRYLRCGRDALGYVADLLNRKSGILLIPAYSCESMIQPFLTRGWNVEYYPINSDFSVDLEFIVSTFEKIKPDAILLMNFYGISDTSKSIDLIKKKCSGLQIIEDFTHIIFDIEKTFSIKVDYYIGSIRKWMGITDGAIVISTKKEIPEILYKENDFVTLRRKGLFLKELYHHSTEPSIKLVYRKLLSDAENTLENGKTPYLISPFSQQILDHLNCETLKKSRTWNTEVLLKFLKNLPKIQLPTNIDQILENTPFSVPILVENRDNIQMRLAENGIYASVLWPINEAARKISPFAAIMEESMLSIPIDQRYEAGDMEHIYNVIKLLVS